MGSSSSKSSAAAGAPPSPVARKVQSSRNRIFRPSCLRSVDYEGDGSQISKHQPKGNCRTAPRRNDSGVEPDECYESVKTYQPEETGVSSDVELDEWHQSRFYDVPSSSSRLPNSSSPTSISYRLSRANESGSSCRAPSAPSTSFVVSNNEDGLHLQSYSSLMFANKSGRSHSCDLFPACFGNRESQVFSSNSSDHSQHDQHIVSGQGLDVNLFCPESCADGIGTRVADRSTTRAPAERNIQFSRTLSVGRLRDRVVRRAPFHESCPFYREVEVRAVRQGSRRQNFVGGLGNAMSEVNDSVLPSSGVSSSSYNEISRGADATYNELFEHAMYNELLEHRSNFLERRRRIRSQVHALRRLGSRFENATGHSRTCVLSGQHRSGHCSCRTSNREANSDVHSRARDSISRIVMLAEALFEVLDEIHQQSLVLSSQPSVSSIGSLPAPNDVVESLPVKAYYNKSDNHKAEETAKCYICLVDYEDGDNLRVLPCRHEFHRACVDKWLKEVHRVCPLCRGDVCRSERSDALLL
ncbi:unnamed protein product [Cuscuta campestris]|uniref:RING-type domain-containing protein n=1 Tax=Cuscuta campestris TaxID=132261 RepID=A0A484KJ39_9ASTE|nr:unnamed protein product [Cuscuta campestris]